MIASFLIFTLAPVFNITGTTLTIITLAPVFLGIALLLSYLDIF